MSPVSEVTGRCHTCLQVPLQDMRCSSLDVFPPAGDVEMIPEGQGNLPDLNAFRIRPTAHEQDPYTVSASTSRRVTFEGLPAPAADAEIDRRGEHSGQDDSSI